MTYEWYELTLTFFFRELLKQQKEVMSVETALEQQRLFKHNLLLNCKIDGLPLTLLSGALDDISEIEVERWYKQNN